jgi:transposase
MPFFAGLDWGGTEHSVCVIDDKGGVVAQFAVSHDEAGLRGLREQLARIAPAETIPIALERPTGLVVDALVDAGHPVFPIHPNAVKACRPRYRAAGAKSDRGDAYLLADMLRTDGHRLRLLKPASDEFKALRALVRTRDDLVRHRLALARQLAALLDSFWPGATAVFADIDSAIALTFVSRYPTPQSAADLNEKRLGTFLAKHGYSGRRSSAELMSRLRAAAPGFAGEAEATAKGELTRSLAAILEGLLGELSKVSARVERAVEGLSDGKIVMSFPRAGRICAAQILAELGDQRERFPSDAQLASEAGVAPVTSQSGKRRGVFFRYACNHRLRNAITRFADNSRHESSWAADVYSRARARGCDHPHATRILARAWVRVLWRAWHDRKSYEPTLHKAAANLAPESIEG